MDKLDHPLLQKSGYQKIEISDPTVCFYCHTSIDKITNGKCSVCGFPQLGTDEERKKFMMDKRVLKMQLDVVHENGKTIRNMLFVVGFIFLASYIIGFMTTNVSEFLVEGIGICALFFGLGIWAQKNPYKGILAGVITFIGIVIVYALINPYTILAGYLYKILIIGFLYYGWRTGKATENATVELRKKGIEV